ncbi:MAG: AmmeMemoRadiSam system radical SAM enzyme [Acidobacteriia bacterium]|nr:AmmeMemoRadiSam system radical SAM enzyme [Terriglobia bacterium]
MPSSTTPENFGKELLPRDDCIDALPADVPGKPNATAALNLNRRRFLQVAALPCAACAVAASLPACCSEPLHDSPLPQGDAAVEARFYDKLASKSVQCRLCPRQCVVADGGRGYCKVRENRGGTYYSLVHSRLCAAHIDPIEKKPFFHFRPGTLAFSVATGGCNVNCKFCQNWEISQIAPEQLRRQYVTPAGLAAAARQNDCPTLAYTYSEPVIATEYYLDSAEAGHAAGIKSVFVSNGFIRREPLERLCHRMDAIKIDLKAFSDAYYREVVNAELKPILETLVTIRKRGVWLEIVYLTVPSLNDSESELRAMAKWVKSELGPDVPVHFTRFYPLYRLKNLPPTPVETLERAKSIAGAEGLHFVYVGNVPGHAGQHTHCPKCSRVVVERAGFTVRKLQLKNGRCEFCRAPVAGMWT